MSKAAKICAICVNTSSNDSSETWLRIKKSTALTISQNPETEDFDYIADEQKSTEVKQYNPSIDQDLAILPNEPDYDWFFEQYKKHPIGSDAHYKFLITYLCDKQTEGTYYSVKQEGILSFTDFNAVDGVINYNISFCGTPVEGTTSISNGTFTFSAASSSSSGG